MKKIVSTPEAPEAIGPYSQAVKVGNFIFTAGQIAINPDTQQMVNGGIKAQTEQVINNLKAVLKAAGFSLADVVKADVFLKNLEDFAQMNEVYAQFFSASKPARTTVAVGDLPKGALVEISVIATE
ncbi:MAG: hypothetical protein B5M53_12620 [Candidatus Cloacimonas sp. 4484_209]|nr:MAG: hypothetical protein B5M53_12620 [Candidatus Cloacimonas sp. 4484_209]